MRLRTIMTIVFCLTAFMPMLLFWLSPNSDYLRSEAQLAREKQLMVARSLAGTLGKYHANLSDAFGEIAKQSLARDSYQPPRTLLRVLDLQNICVANFATGAVVVSNSGLGGACPSVFSEQQLNWFAEQIGGLGDTVVISDAAKTTDEKIAFYALYRSENRLIVGKVLTDIVVDLGKPVRFDDLGHATIVDSAGQVLYHPERSFLEKLVDMSGNSAVKKAISGGSGIEEFYSDFFRDDITSAYSHVPGANWGVLVAEPVSALYDRVEKAKFSSLFPLGIGLLIAIVLAFFATRLLTFPIVQMVQAMERIGNGELRAYEKIRESRFQPREFKKARDSIKVMADKLQENIDTISKHAYLDGITGLPNRECFKVLAQQEIEKLAARKQKGALLFLDLDGFKQVNDVYGHRSGDDLLQGFAQNIHTYCGNEMKRRASGVDNAINILPARLGGDEFVVFLGNIRSQEDLGAFANGLFERVFGKFRLHNGVVLNVSGSVGGAMFPEHAADFDELLRLADIAMYKAKKSGKGRFCLHEEVDEFAANEASLAYDVDA